MGGGLALIAALGVAVALFAARSGVQGELQQRVVDELQQRLGGEVTVDRVRLRGTDEVELVGVRWLPAGGVLAAAEVERVELTVDAGALLDGATRLSAGRASGVRLVIANESPPADPVVELDASDRGGPADLLPRAVAWTGGPLPDDLAGSLATLTSLAEDGAVLTLEQGVVEGLPGAVVCEGLTATITVVGDGAALVGGARLGEVGTLDVAADLQPNRPLAGEVVLESVPLELVAPRILSSDTVELNGGVMDVALATEYDEALGAATWSLSLDVRDGVARLDEFRDQDLPVRSSHRIEAVPGAGGTRLDIRDWRWSFNQVSGSGSGRLLSLDAKPEVRLVVQLDQVPYDAIMGSLPGGVVPEEWGIELGGTVDLTVRLGGPLHDRSAWDLGWKGDWSRLTVLASGVGGRIHALRSSFPYSIRVSDDEYIHRVMGPEDPHFISLELIHPHLQAATVVCEDASFHKHGGFDERELREAILENLRTGGGGRGGSTITQQVAKNLFLSGERTWTRKLQEAVLTFSIEQTLDKRRIHEIYLNLAQFGPGVYGVRDAAHHYFGTSTRQLNTLECIFLATMLPSPSRYHDYYHPQGVVSARWDEHMREVLARMHSQGYLKDTEFDMARYQSVRFVPCANPRSSP